MSTVEILEHYRDKHEDDWDSDSDSEIELTEQEVNDKKDNV